MTDRRRFTGTCKTRHETIVAYLWEEYPRWVAAPALIKLEMPYGSTGSSGDVRARELARNECADHVKDRVERADGRDIGTDPRFAYYRYKPQRRGPTTQDLEDAQRAVEMFDNYQSAR